MKRKVLISAALLCCATFCFAFFADVTGKWTGAFKIPNGGDFPVTYVFKADGTTLTGAAISDQGEVSISEGKINGSDFTFTLPFNGADLKNVGKYYAAGDSVAIDVDYNGAKLHANLKRVTN